MNQNHPSQNYNPNYTPMFPVANHTSPPPSFTPVHGDFVPSRGHSAQQSSFDRDMGPSYAAAASSASIRAQLPISRKERGDMFAAFLEADERSRQQNLGPSRPGSGYLEWPTMMDLLLVAMERDLEDFQKDRLIQVVPTWACGQGSWLELFASGASSAPGAAPDKSAHQGTSWERAGRTSSRDDLANNFGWTMTRSRWTKPKQI
ncbi:hypothetical protein BDZ97DRAFT_2082275 [Flammula alnicola]|nr:hypothetical protein BDZ97DRAFT_2082275 [Flammula alnicola]